MSTPNISEQYKMESEEPPPHEHGKGLRTPKMPSKDWDLAVFLCKLQDDITVEDLKRMKFLLKGLDKTGNRDLEEIKDPLDFFEHLRQRLLIARDNIIQLQAFMWHINRKDLHLKIVEFSKQNGNILHFDQVDNKTLNGPEPFLFYIAGNAMIDGNQLQEIREVVARLLCVESRFVGVAIYSILVTFVRPERRQNDQSESKFLPMDENVTVVIETCTGTSCERFTFHHDTAQKVFGKVLTEMEASLDEEQHSILKQKFLMSTQRINKYQDSGVHLLGYLWNCEVEKKCQNDVDFYNWMVTILSTINRMSLLEDWKKMAIELFHHAVDRYNEKEDDTEEERSDSESKDSDDSETSTTESLMEKKIRSSLSCVGANPTGTITKKDTDGSDEESEMPDSIGISSRLEAVIFSHGSSRGSKRGKK